MANRSVVIAASPRANGFCAQVADGLVQRRKQAEPSADIKLLSLFDLHIAGCNSCDGCRGDGVCVIHDDMRDVLGALDEATDVTVVAPVYFSGNCSQCKAMLDRLQPHFWLNTRSKPKRPATLIVAREGGDPWGFEPLVTEFRSAFAVAGFTIDTVVDGLGKTAHATVDEYATERGW